MILEKKKVIVMLDWFDHFLRVARDSVNLVKRNGYIVKILRDDVMKTETKNGLNGIDQITHDLKEMLEGTAKPIYNNKTGKISESIKTLASFFLDKAIKLKQEEIAQRGPIIAMNKLSGMVNSLKNIGRPLQRSISLNPRDADFLSINVDKKSTKLTVSVIFIESEKTRKWQIF